jgi:hypothetical protein
VAYLLNTFQYMYFIFKENFPEISISRQNSSGNTNKPYLLFWGNLISKSQNICEFCLARRRYGRWLVHSVAGRSDGNSGGCWTELLVVYLCCYGNLSFGFFFVETRSQRWSRSYFTTDSQSVSQSVSQYVLVSSTLVGLATRNYFLSECCCLKFAVLYPLGALSDERTGL